eukprot:Gb_23053 [translate_table: standard]
MWRPGSCYWGRNDEDSRGIVVELAWMLSRRRNLEPYVRLYQSFRWDSLVCHSHLLNLFFPGQATLLALSVLDELAKEVEKRPRPVIFAAFSGAPKSCLYKVFQILQGKCGGLNFDSGKYELVRKCIAGQIYDSSPVDFISELGANFAVHPTVLNLSQPPRVLRWGAQATAWALDALFLNRFETQRAEYWQTLYSSVNMGPILILCSEDDDLAPFQTICNFASRLRKLGGDVKLVVWKGSPHVGHYRHHPEEYRDAVLKLLTAASLFYSQRMEKLLHQEFIRRGPNCKMSESVCSADKGAALSHENSHRIASGQTISYYLPSFPEAQTFKCLGSFTDGQKGKMAQIQSCSNPDARSILHNLLFDVDLPKDIEDWEIEPFSLSPGMIDDTASGPGATVSINPIKFIRRCRL